ERIFKDISECGSVIFLTLALFKDNIREAVPDIRIDFFNGEVVSEILHIESDIRGKLIEFFFILGNYIPSVFLGKYEPRDVPELVGEVLVSFDALFVELNVSTDGAA